MSIDQIAPEALRLPAKDRALLAASLWESIEDPFSVANELGEDAAIDLALVRDEDISSGRITAISHSDLMARLRA